ncbi:phytanoyl-CoA dioxygenase family protein [Qipengyuania huizhouensis]|uniref:phytanoyl-CoA dioxygenase family protein n=1 Tax=Qipengyuania huizhouensis TaxID=2867245 RepID=UPI001C88BDDD|nr:phytanoyl-CoA dioxygenase family protein [Qipengyuania huizhouensis]MBX7460382.1 phytanoyl-CoA dioxygenase family protein [Qipengyuania huizhouensis]
MEAAKSYLKTIASSAWIRLLGGRGEFYELADRTALVREGDLSKEVCTQLVDRIDDILSVRSQPRVWRDKVDSDARIWGFEQDIGDLVDQFQISRRIEAIEKYLGRPVRSWFLMANRVVPQESNQGSGGGFHRDSPFSHQVKCIWYLTDVASDNGPFEFIPGSHSNAIPSRDRYPLGHYRLENIHKDDRLVEVLADAGSLLVCDTKCIHRGKPIETGSRYAVTLYTSPHKDGWERQLRGLGLDFPPKQKVFDE